MQSDAYLYMIRIYHTAIQFGLLVHPCREINAGHASTP